MEEKEKREKIVRKRKREKGRKRITRVGGRVGGGGVVSVSV